MISSCFSCRKRIRCVSVGLLLTKKAADVPSCSLFYFVRCIISAMLNFDNAPASRILFDSLERRLPKQTFETWFRPLSLRSSSSDRVLTFAAPNAVVKDWILAHYADVIRDCLGESALNEYKVEWTLPSESKEVGSLARPQEQSSPPGASPGRYPPEEGEAIRFVDTAPSPLNEKYTFQNFVVASCNRFAHAAIVAAAALQPVSRKVAAQERVARRPADQVLDARGNVSDRSSAGRAVVGLIVERDRHRAGLAGEGDGIDARSAIDGVRSGNVGEEVIAVVAREHVGVGAGPGERVVTRASGRVQAHVRAGQVVVARASRQRHRATVRDHRRRVVVVIELHNQRAGEPTGQNAL